MWYYHNQRQIQTKIATKLKISYLREIKATVNINENANISIIIQMTQIVF